MDSVPLKTKVLASKMRVRPSLDQNSVILMSEQLMAVPGNVLVDIGCSDHSLVWMDNRVAKSVVGEKTIVCGKSAR